MAAKIVQNRENAKENKKLIYVKAGNMLF